jgi:signal peptidase I
MADGGDKQRGEDDDKRRSPRHVRAAARILQKEARKILKKHSRRIAAEPADAIRACVAAIDTQRDAQDYEALEEEAEKLDELLHQHASFARKSALRETIENIGIAVLIALGLRTCVYEPFKIPSGSMMPTLRKGDHIFVNKFAYGVQIPFTVTVVGESLGEIERGDVIVFRYPLDKSEDFIKRVIGLPGDQIKVMGRSVALRREGDAEFEVLERKRLEDKCYDEDGKNVVSGCQLYEETIGDKTYVVRYMSSGDTHEEFAPRARVWTVPEGHLLVMGDNRDQSHDSLQWTVRVEAVAGDRLLSVKDLRDLTSERRFREERPNTVDEMGDPRHDHLTYFANHRSRPHDVALSVWRDPPLSAKAMFEALAAQVPDGRERTVAEILEGAPRPSGAERDRTLEVGATIDRLVVGRDELGWRAVAYLEPAQAVLEMRCGPEVCKTAARLAVRLTRSIGEFAKNHEQDTRELVDRPPRIRYQTNWSGRSDVRDHYFESAFAKREDAGPRDTVRLRAFRKPKQELDLLLDAALRQAGSNSTDATHAEGVGERAFVVEGTEQNTVVIADDVREMLVVLDCGKSRCPTPSAATVLAEKIASRFPEAAGDRRKLKNLLVAADVPGMEESKVVRPARNPFDRVRLEATVQGADHSVELEVWRTPEEGLETKVAELRDQHGLESDESITSIGGYSQTEEGFHFVFAVEPSKTVVRLMCRKGLCPTKESAVGIARTVAEKAQDVTNFVEPDAERPRPFVPRGHVKGRADRIWLPMSRFWLEIR